MYLKQYSSRFAQRDEAKINVVYMDHILKRLILASNNSGKLWEIRERLDDERIELIAQSELSVPEWVETGKTFIENAIGKARHAAEYTGLPALGDDSGLCVNALRGAPGLYSARYAGESATAHDNIKKLLAAMQDVPQHQRQAHFYCVLALCRYADDPMPIIAEGIWHGEILPAPSGERGFGYDPIFQVPTHAVSAANLASEVKNQISHRGIALTQLTSKIKSLVNELA